MKTALKNYMKRFKELMDEINGTKSLECPSDTNGATKADIKKEKDIITAKIKETVKNAVETGRRIWAYLNNLDKKTDISESVFDWVRLNDDDTPQYALAKTDGAGGEDLHLGVVALAGVLCAVGAFFGAAIGLIGLLP